MAYWRKLTRNQRFIVTTGGYYDYTVNSEKTHRLVLTEADKTKQKNRAWNKFDSRDKRKELNEAKAYAKHNKLADLLDALAQEKEYEEKWKISAHLAYKVNRRVKWQTGDKWPTRVLHFVGLYQETDIAVEAAACGYDAAKDMLNSIQRTIRILKQAVIIRKKYYYE